VRWPRLLAAAGAIPLIAAVAVAASQSPTPALKTAGDEREPAVDGSYLAWTEAPRAHPDRFRAYARKGGKPRFRVNRRGTVGFTWGGAIDGKRLVYGQARNARAQSDLKFFDLASRKRTGPPAGVNTARIENGASLSGDWLLFRREKRARSSFRIILFNPVTKEAITLDAAHLRRYAQPGNVGGNYATWIRCRRFTFCTTFVYDIAAGTRSRVPNPSHRAQYAASITAGGVVYFAESDGGNCGAHIALWRYPLGETRTKLISLPRDRDPLVTSPLVAAGGTTLFFDGINCRTSRGDIFKLPLGRGATTAAGFRARSAISNP
jgi:hypothetical protein